MSGHIFFSVLHHPLYTPLGLLSAIPPARPSFKTPALSCGSVCVHTARPLPAHLQQTFFFSSTLWSSGAFLFSLPDRSGNQRERATKRNTSCFLLFLRHTARALLCPWEFWLSVWPTTTPPSPSYLYLAILLAACVM